MPENPLHGKIKVQRGKVRHEIFDKAKERHISAYIGLVVQGLSGSTFSITTKSSSKSGAEKGKRRNVYKN